MHATHGFFALALAGLLVGCAGDPQGDDGEPPADDDTADDDSGDDDTTGDDDSGDDDSGDDDSGDDDTCIDHCYDGSLNCGETDVDCGGLDCGSCAPQTLWGTGDDASGKHPSVIVVRPDFVMVLFGRDDRSTPIQYSCYDGSNWTPLADATSFDSWRPNPVVDSAGAIQMVFNAYQGNSPQSVYHSVYSGDCASGSWSPEVLVSGAGDAMDNSSTEPCLAIDEGDVLWAGWSQARAATLWSNNECATDQDCDDAFGADLYDCRGGKCWPFYDLYLSQGSGGSWTDPLVINEGYTGYFSHLALAVVHSDLAFATWMKGDDGVDIWFASWDGVAISEPVDTGLGLQFSEVVADEDFVHVFANGQAKYRRRAVSGGWYDAVSLGSSDQDFPDLVLDAAGVLHAVWNADDQIWYRIGEAATGVWTEPAKVVSANPSSSHPWIAVDSAGFAHIVWAGGDDHGPVWYVKVRHEDLPSQ